MSRPTNHHMQTRFDKSFRYPSRFTKYTSSPFASVHVHPSLQLGRENALKLVPDSTVRLSLSRADS